MNNSEKTMGKRNTILAISYIKCSQVIEIQVYEGCQSPGKTPFSEIAPDMEADKETEIWYAMRAIFRSLISDKAMRRDDSP